MRGEMGKKSPEKEMDNGGIFITSHMTLFYHSLFYSLLYSNKLKNQKIKKAESKVDDK